MDCSGLSSSFRPFEHFERPHIERFPGTRFAIFEKSFAMLRVIEIPVDEVLLSPSGFLYLSSKVGGLGAYLVDRFPRQLGD
jgi:hypothetical protein